MAAQLTDVRSSFGQSLYLPRRSLSVGCAAFRTEGMNEEEG